MNVRGKMEGKHYPHKPGQKHPPTRLLIEEKRYLTARPGISETSDNDCILVRCYMDKHRPRFVMSASLFLTV